MTMTQNYRLEIVRQFRAILTIDHLYARCGLDSYEGGFLPPAAAIPGLRWRRRRGRRGGGGCWFLLFSADAPRFSYRCLFYFPICVLLTRGQASPFLRLDTKKKHILSTAVINNNRQRSAPLQADRQGSCQFTRGGCSRAGKHVSSDHLQLLKEQLATGGRDESIKSGLGDLGGFSEMRRDLNCCELMPEQ
jgi:hypothetical protein